MKAPLIVVPLAGALLVALFGGWTDEELPTKVAPSPVAVASVKAPSKLREVAAAKPAPRARSYGVDEAPPAETVEVDTRAQVLEERLLDAARPVSTAELEQALRDPEPQLRLRALTQAVLIGIPISASVLEQMALKDESADVRRTAIAALTLHPDVPVLRAEQLAAQAANDSDLSVQSAAVEMLEHLEAKHSLAPVLEVNPSIP